MSIDQMRDGVEWVKAELRQIDAAAGDAPLDAETEARFQAGLSYVRETESEIVKVEERKRAAVEFAAARGHVDAPPAQVRDAGFSVNTRTNPFDLSDLPHGEARSSELKARAVDVIEKHVPKYMPDSVREGATATAERRSTKQYDADLVNAAIVETTSPEYLREFERHLREPQSAHRLGEFRAAMSLTAANGGVLVPQFLDPTIVLTNAGTQNDVRRISSVRQITVDQWDGVTSAGVSAEWLAENTQAADATPTFVGPTITAHKLAAYMEGSYEVIADSGFDEIGMLIADAFDRKEADGFVNGTGSGQPYGLITRLSGSGPVVAGSSGAAGAADFVAADIYAMSEALGARWRQSASWLGSHAIYNDVRAFGTSNTAHSFWTSFGGGTPSELIGYPTYHAEELDSTVVSGSNDYVLVLGAFDQYRIIDRIGTSIQFVPVVFGANQRPTGTAGWFSYKRVGADCLTSNAFKVLKL
jgi:HK97 family phage major capsid protein